MWAVCDLWRSSGHLPAPVATTQSYPEMWSAMMASSLGPVPVYKDAEFPVHACRDTRHAELRTTEIVDFTTHSAFPAPTSAHPQSSAV